ncbi:MAG TPA: enoyl-CoA hydratase [Acidimicrobiales bacterium]|jgi:enoyl-CoA hydratase|nr:enoyl-CoA hydratase [Acidimicrobiales bacterium]
MPDTTATGASGDDIVLLDVADRVATITLNRPRARNALSSAVRRRIPELAAEADGRDDVDVLILTGADPAFCAGIDLKELGSGEGSLDDAPLERHLLPQRPRRGPIPDLTKPLIGAINGVAITGGLELALACDFLVASEQARFADTHSRVGIQPGWGLTVLLPEAVGLRRAREMSATGNFVDATTALQWGLVNHVVPHDELLPFCRQLGADIASNDQAGVRRIFATYRDGAITDGTGAWDLEAAVAKEWQGGGIDPAEVERRRQAVVARGRTQV